MRARLRLAVAVDERGRSALSALRAEPPMLARLTASDPLVVHLVGAAAGPIGGDRMDSDIEIGAGATLAVRSVAASVVQPGPHPHQPSQAITRVRVGSHAHLDWWPQPTVSVSGSDHTMTTTIELQGSSTLRWVDVVVAGRSEEPGGTLTLHHRTTVEGVPLVHHTLRIDGSDRSRCAHRGRVLVSVLTVDQASATAPDSQVTSTARVVRCPLSPGFTVWSGVGDDHDEVFAALSRLGLVDDGCS